MTWVRTVPEAAAEGELAAAYARVRAARGEVSNLHLALGARPDALAAFVDLQAAALHGPEASGRLSRRERELVGLVVSHESGDTYGLTHHADAFSRYVTEPGLVALVAAGAIGSLRAPHLPPREAALAAFAAKLARDPRGITEEDAGALRKAGLSDGEIVELVLAVAFVAAVNRVALGLGVGRDDATKAFRY